MSISAEQTEWAEAVKVAFTRDRMTVTLLDGRELRVPLDWYPRLKFSTARERENWRIIDDGRGINWPDLDEDLSVEGLLAGLPSGESQKSLARWLEGRGKKGRRTA